MKSRSTIQKIPEYLIGAMAFGASAIDALLRSRGREQDVRAQHSAVFHKCLPRSDIRALSNLWNCSNETACHLLASQLAQKLQTGTRPNRRLVTPLVYQRSTDLEKFGNYLIPFEFTCNRPPDPQKAAHIDKWRARIHSFLTPFGQGICEAYVTSGLGLASILPTWLVENMRRGWAYRFSASSTVVPFPARGFDIGGANVAEILCFTPQLTKFTPAITFTTYRDKVSLIIRYPAEITDAQQRINAILHEWLRT